jgi:hypothetical protein
MAELAQRLMAHWGRALEPAPAHWLIDWVVASLDGTVTAVAAHVEADGDRVLVSADVWASLRSLSNTLRVPHILVAQFDDRVLYRAWQAQSGVHYPMMVLEDFLVVSIPLAPEEWKPVL